MVYVLDQVVAFEEELLQRIKQQGLNVKPQILVVSKIADKGCFLALMGKQQLTFLGFAGHKTDT